MNLDMEPLVEMVYMRGNDSQYNEHNPYSRACGSFFWWQAGYVDAWNQLPKEIKDN